jgi:hypothetical protein
MVILDQSKDFGELGVYHPSGGVEGHQFGFGRGDHAA